MVFLPKEYHVKVIIICCLSWINCVQSFAASSSRGEQFSTRKDRDVFPKHRYWSRVIESTPIAMPLECYINCMKNCRCASYNICELNSEKKENNASLYEQSDECDYHEYQFTKKVGLWLGFFPIGDSQGVTQKTQHCGFHGSTNLCTG